jgi:hypothetical protein
MSKTHHRVSCIFCGGEYTGYACIDHSYMAPKTGRLSGNLAEDHIYCTIAPACEHHKISDSIKYLGEE